MSPMKPRSHLTDGSACLFDRGVKHRQNPLSRTVAACQAKERRHAEIVDNSAVRIRNWQRPQAETGTHD